jgi:hypothetical protein
MRFSRSRSISRRIRLLHEYGKLASKKLTVNVFGAFVFLAFFLLGAQHSSAQATPTSPLTAVDNVDLRPLRRQVVQDCSLSQREALKTVLANPLARLPSTFRE